MELPNTTYIKTDTRAWFLAEYKNHPDLLEKLVASAKAYNQAVREIYFLHNNSLSLGSDMAWDA